MVLQDLGTPSAIYPVGSHGQCTFVPEQSRNPYLSGVRLRTHRPCVPTDCGASVGGGVKRRVAIHGDRNAVMRLHRGAALRAVAVFPIKKPRFLCRGLAAPHSGAETVAVGKSPRYQRVSLFTTTA